MTRKAGVITYHHYQNYGTELQAFALQQVIAAMPGFDCELIDCRLRQRPHFSKRDILKMRLRRLFHYLTNGKKVYRKWRYKNLLAKKNPAFEAFYDNYFVVSDKTYQTESELFENPPRYDIYVTGSDQTWSPLVKLRPALFLKFAPAEARKIALLAAGQSRLISFSEFEKPLPP